MQKRSMLLSVIIGAYEIDWQVNMHLQKLVYSSAGTFTNVMFGFVLFSNLLNVSTSQATCNISNCTCDQSSVNTWPNC